MEEAEEDVYLSWQTLILLWTRLCGCIRDAIALCRQDRLLIQSSSFFSSSVVRDRLWAARDVMTVRC